MTRSVVLFRDLLIPLLPLAAFLVNGLFGRWTREKAHWVSVPAVVLSFLLSLLVLKDVLSGVNTYASLYRWITVGAFDVSVGVMIDPLAAVMLIVVTSVSSLVHVYSIGYMHGDRGYARFFAYLSLFTFSMLMLVLSNNLLELFVFWEAVGLCSYLLIGHWYERRSAADAATKAFVVNRVGDFGFGLGLLLIFVTLGTLDYQAVFLGAKAASNQTVDLLAPFGGKLEVGLVTLIALLLFTGAMGKSAQLPLHVWLPDAMEGPTPVSALIHAATMVTAGVYMVARMHPVFEISPAAMATVAVVGGGTALFAATIGLVQNDIKRVVAYSTVSQLGTMFLACGIGAYGIAIFHLMTHAFFKGLLFLGAGSVIHALSGEQDIRKMGGLRNKIPATYLTFLIGSLSLAGVPLFAGFFSKDEILTRAFFAGDLGRVLWGVALLGALMTAFYAFRLVYLVFHGETRLLPDAAHRVHESPPVMTVPLWILAVLAVFSGWVGIPLIAGGDKIGHFLEPVFAGVAHAVHADIRLEGALIAVSVIVALLGIAIADMLYRTRPATPDKVAATWPRLYSLFLNKWWFDEIFDWAIVRPTRRISESFLWKVADVRIIDAFVNGVGSVTQQAAASWRRIQTGFTQDYAMTLVLGLLLVAAVWLAAW
ncbi:MAG: NADH-quinone oxidoreductase subunit L [Nitrospirae bacterium]|nr:NADH-quinone oxidoreductase subunit L [Nitrospirota bacterium]